MTPESDSKSPVIPAEACSLGTMLARGKRLEHSESLGMSDASVAGLG